MRTITVITGLACSLLVAACNMAITKEQKVKAAVRESLIDPDSAKFEDLYPGKQAKYYCGFVNAKNRMGGYAGQTPFVHEALTPDFGTVTLVQEPPEDSDFRSLKNSPDFGKEYEKVHQKCRSIALWNEACAVTPVRSHDLCPAMMDPKGGGFVDLLYQRFP